MQKKLLIGLMSLLSCAGCVSEQQRFLYNQKPAFYSYMIGDIHSNDIDTAQNEAVYMTPASCQKTITALLAYKTLGNDYRYKTTLSVTKQAETIQDVIITFSGDPTLTSENLIQLLSPLRGVKITGKVILDTSLFQTQPYSNNIMKDDIGSAYLPPVAAMNLDRNLITVKALWDPIVEKTLLQNDLGYVMQSDVDLNTDLNPIHFMWQNNVIRATGNWDRQEEFLETQVSPVDIHFYMKAKLKKIMETLTLSNEVVIIQDRSQLPTELILINTWESEPLATILPPALKQSDNLVFDSLYLTMLHTQSPNIQRWEEGDPIIKALIKKHFDMDIGDALIVDGSGISRYNRLQTAQLFALLRKGYEVKEFVNALPISGEINTTLDNRRSLPNGLKAKTGSMSGISCLCGYHINDHEHKAFVIVANSFAPPLSEMYKVQDKFIQDYLGR